MSDTNNSIAIIPISYIITDNLPQEQETLKTVTFEFFRAAIVLVRIEWR